MEYEKLSKIFENITITALILAIGIFLGGYLTQPKEVSAKENVRFELVYQQSGYHNFDVYKDKETGKEFLIVENRYGLEILPLEE